MTGAELTALSIADLQRLLRRKEISPTEALEALIERIGQVDEKIDAYLSLDEESARGRSQTRRRHPAAWRRADCGKGHHQCFRTAVHLRLENSRKLSVALRCHCHPENSPRGRHSLRQNEPRRIRHGLIDRTFGIQVDAESVGRIARARRFEWRLGRGRGRG